MISQSLTERMNFSSILGFSDQNGSARTKKPVLFLFFSSYLIVLLNLIIYVLKKEETLSILYVFFLNFKKTSNRKSA